jgi:hypothetical protein
MTWTIPFTAIAGTPFTAAQYNTNIRDNMVETEVGRAQTATGYCVTTGSNQIAERVAVSGFTSASDATASTSYSDPDVSVSGAAVTAGPQVTVITGASAFIAIYGSMTNNSSNAAWIGFAVSGASSIDASDPFAIEFQPTTPQQVRAGATFFRDDLTPGSNTFTLKYRVSTSGTGFFSVRRIAVFPF